VTYVIAEPCIGVKDKSCIEVCPVDCIHEAENQLLIDPQDCGAPIAIRRPRKSVVVVAGGGGTSDRAAWALKESLCELGVEATCLGREENASRIAPRNEPTPWSCAWAAPGLSRCCANSSLS